MRYITNADNYITAISFGCEIECQDDGCTEYTGGVPTGYTSLEDWYADEAEKLYRWKIVNGQLTLDSGAAAPAGDLTPSKLGYGGKITTKIYNTDGTEADFNAKLESVYASMPDETAMQVQFLDINLGTGFTFTGTLYKNYSEYGWLKGTSYNGWTVQKIKREGAWQGWQNLNEAFAPADQYMLKWPSTHGWYRIGVLHSSDLHTAAARITIGGSYWYKNPEVAVIHAQSSHNIANLTYISGCNPYAYTSVFSAIRMVAASETSNYIDLYFDMDLQNAVCVEVQTMHGVFEKIEFTPVGEETAMAYLSLPEYPNPVLNPGVEYRTTERFYGRPVYAYLLHYGYYSKATTSISHWLTGIVTPISIDIMNNEHEILTNSSGMKNLTLDRTSIGISCDWDMGNVFFLMKYTKEA